MPRPAKLSALALYRHSAALSQRELAELAGVGRRTVIRAENGQVWPLPSTRRALAAALGAPVSLVFPLPVDLSELMNDQGYPPTPTQEQRPSWVEALEDGAPPNDNGAPPARGDAEVKIAEDDGDGAARGEGPRYGEP